jgi:hypothetical protein
MAGEADRGALRLDFDRRLMLRFRGSVITSDGGLLAYRELDDALALTASGGERLAEARTGRNRRHLLVGLRAKYLDTRSGRIRLTAIPDNSAASIEAFVRANVKTGTTLLTDGHRSYPGLTDYRHDPRTVGKMAGMWHRYLPQHIDLPGTAG